MSSDSELSDGMLELQELVKEYNTKATKIKQEDSKNVNNKSEAKAVKETNMYVEGPMDKVIFGDKAGLLKKMARAVGEEKSDDASDDVAEPTAVDDMAQEEVSANDPPGVNRQKKAQKRKPVWTDADDEQIQVGEVKRETKFTGPLDHLRMDKTYKEYLTARFTRIVAQPKWASLDHKKEHDDDDSQEEDEDLLRKVGFLAKPTASALPAHHIEYKCLKDLNRATYAEGPISKVCFHPSSTAALVCGLSGVATIYSIDGQKNEKLHNVKFRKYPIKCAHITPSGTEAIFGSNKRFFYSYDLLKAQETRHTLPKHIATMQHFEVSPCGRYLAAAGRLGELHLFDAVSKEFIHTFKQEDTVAGLRFTADSRRIICSSKSNTVNIFDMRAQRLEHTFYDEGCITGRVLDLASNQRLLATGTREGVVNVYDFDTVFESKTPHPIKAVMNLTTAISDVKFNHTSELLAMCSNEVPAAVKLVHFPSGTVYKNFPGFQSGIGKIRTVDFSPSSGFLTLGSTHKEVLLFRLKHYKNY